MNTCPFHSSTKHEVSKINVQDGCPVTTLSSDVKDIPVVSLNSVQHKQEYYRLLLKYLPVIVEITRKMRKDFPLGLVMYKDKNDGARYDNLITALDDVFLQELQAASERKDFLRCSYLVHNAIGVSIDIATEIWAAEADWNSSDLERLLELVDTKRQELYGKKAAQKRISSAMMQTLHISASMEQFIYCLLKKRKKGCSRDTIERYHHGTLKTALSLTELHLERTREIRPVFGAETDGGIIHRYVHSSFCRLACGRLELRKNSLSKAMKSRTIDSSDGRIGCPGKKHVPEIWRWIESVSQQYSYPAVG